MESFCTVLVTYFNWFWRLENDWLKFGIPEKD